MTQPLTLEPESLTSGLFLRALEPIDVDFLYEAENDKTAWKDSDTTAPYSRSQLREYALNYEADPFKDRQIRLVVSLRDGTPAGLADLYEISPVNRNAFVAIYVTSRFRRRGIASEALRLLAGYAFETLGLTRLAARVAADNFPSESLFRKSGFSLAGTMEGWLLRNATRRVDQLIFTSEASHQHHQR